MFGVRRPRKGIYPMRTSLALSGKRSGTKLNGAAKGAALLQLISLSTDVSQGPYGIYALSRARLLAKLKCGAVFAAGCWRNLSVVLL